MQIVLSASTSITEIAIEEEEIDSNSSYAGALASSARNPGRLRWQVAAFLMVAALVIGGWFGWQRSLGHTGGSPVQVVLMPVEGTTGDAILNNP